MQLQEEISRLTRQHFDRAPDQCDDHQLYQALLILARQRAQARPAPTGDRKLYYFSAEFLLGKLLSILEKEDSGGNFRVLPMEGAAWAEPYRKAISPLVDFSIIRQRINQFGYTQDGMLKDLEQLYENTAKFNGADHELTGVAKRFVDTAKQFIEDNKDVRAEKRGDL